MLRLRSTVQSPLLLPACYLLPLQWLHLSHTASLEPRVLSNMTRLQHLALSDTFLCEGTMGTTQLLQVLPQLQHLQHLDLKRVLQHPPPNLSLFTAMCASSALTHLSLQLVDMGMMGDCTAAKAFESIFPTLSQQAQAELDPQQQQKQPCYSLRQLELQLHSSWPAMRSSSDRWNMGALASCCSRLTDFSIECCGLCEPPVLTVHQLTQITRLSIAARQLKGQKAKQQAQDVALLTQL